MKIGGELLGWKDTGEWHLAERGVYVFTTNPPDLERRFPAEARSTTRPRGTSAVSTRIVVASSQNTGNWNVDIPRPTFGVWIGDNWKVNNSLTLNLGIRYDLDRGATAPPDMTNTTVFKPFNAPLFNPDIHDNNNCRAARGVCVERRRR